MVIGDAFSEHCVLRYACGGLHSAGSPLRASEQRQNRSRDDSELARVAALFEATDGESGAPANAGVDRAATA